MSSPSTFFNHPVVYIMYHLSSTTFKPRNQRFTTSQKGKQQATQTMIGLLNCTLIGRD